MSQTTNVKQVKMNIMTQQQYEVATKNPSELYVVTDAEVYSPFTGATGSATGTSGLVPAPAATDNGKYLKGDGTWGVVNSAPDIDNTTITQNTSDELQTVAVIDNNSGNAIKTWTGTKAEYDAINTTTTTTLLYAWTSGTTTVYTTTATPVAWEDNICDANGTINTVELISSVSSDFTTITTSNEGNGTGGSGNEGGNSTPRPIIDPGDEDPEDPNDPF